MHSFLHHNVHSVKSEVVLSGYALDFYEALALGVKDFLKENPTLCKNFKTKVLFYRSDLLRHCLHVMRVATFLEHSAGNPQWKEQDPAQLRTEAPRTRGADTAHTHTHTHTQALSRSHDLLNYFVHAQHHLSRLIGPEPKSLLPWPVFHGTARIRSLSRKSLWHGTAFADSGDSTGLCTSTWARCARSCQTSTCGQKPFPAGPTHPQTQHAGQMILSAIVTLSG